jgi:hypothetical protein
VTIQPVNFYIPPEIQAGLNSGDLTRYGGVVRNSMGHIVEHLVEVPVTVGSQEAVKRIAASLKNRWVIIGLGTVAVGGGIALRAVTKRKQTRKCVESYNASLGAYLEAVRDGDLDAGIISRLISDLDAVQTYSVNGSVTVDFSTAQAETLVNLVVDFTRELAEANSVELNELEDLGPTAENDVVVDLCRHLEAQRQIFTKAG